MIDDVLEELEREHRDAGFKWAAETKIWSAAPALIAIARAARRVQEERHIDTDARMALHAALDSLI